MDKVILITDEVYASMVQKSIKPNVDVQLYLEFDRYFYLEEEDRKSEQAQFLQQVSRSLETSGEIDYVFCFILKRHFITIEELADWVKAALLYLNVPEEKIIDGSRIYSSFYPKERYKRILSNPHIDSLDGMVLGISHAMTGIKSSYLPAKVLNFACSSQDLYFNYYTAEKIWEEYVDKVRKVKYVIIDMFDYTYFNYETLYTGASMSFLTRSGLDCPKLFDEMENKSLNSTSENINAYLASLRNASDEERELLNQYFDDLVGNDENAYSDEYLYSRDELLTDKEIEKYKESKAIIAIQQRIFEETIMKNVKYFSQLLEFLYAKNPHMKIFCIMLPKYILVEEFEQELLGEWKIFFENILSNIQQKYPFVYLNYKDEKDITSRQEYWGNLTHLSTEGSIVFSQRLAEDIKKYVCIE